ncbi:hypothetical protein [Luteimonas fraxinea]|uniref:hypothetical protein n=1 Tax=Luteimonas fraxinea TaxID=2901869 RepID=UPI001E644C12|nr:hypothetical protein [Luteimonas fraxinea]MCD9125852.1 hypothetical protein [Luteimonas fraxinea]
MTTYHVTYKIDERIDPTGIIPSERECRIVNALRRFDARREQRTDGTRYVLESAQSQEHVFEDLARQLGPEDKVSVEHIDPPEAD